MDHLPVEMKCHFWAVQARPQANSEQPQGTPCRPRMDRLAVPGAEARQLKQRWRAALTERMQSWEGEHGSLTWEALASICLETSEQILGRSTGPLKRPNLRGHEAENEQLDANVADALAYLRSFREDEEPIGTLCDR